ncbi:MAG: 16S rRNA (cytidine(1402)-2'-O)-methyltransferase [Candidatus Omnitrophica bacterium]|nr:16S rRNA (cytidine(1402)-2'-O)-methyltransferase [Candidatus Omnitrophota bacterium]MDD5653386.1 16S rRNA (cytidine(1402)-2'-O)-methyltransferase [Candidatus Omnitrophota bacterium]
MLYIVATPIGNLKDITFRAIEVLKSVDLIACEDTRHTKILLDHYNISKPTTSYFQHNRLSKGEYLLSLLKEGKDVALVSDAGTPGILDPGFHIINLAIKNNISITVIPGPTAFVNALVVSGKPTHEFFFAGFLPNRTIARRNRLKEFAKEKNTLIFYESCHRIIATLGDISSVYGDIEVVVGRELTKKFEEIIRDKPAKIIEKFKKSPPKGEFVVII